MKMTFEEWWQSYPWPYLNGTTKTHCEHAWNAATEAAAAQVASEATEEYRKMFADLMNFMVDMFHQDPLRDEGAVEMATRLLADFKAQLESVTKERDELERRVGELEAELKMYKPFSSTEIGSTSYGH